VETANAKKKNTFELKQYKLVELATLYNIHRDTFRKQIALLDEKIGKRKGYYYSVTQVKIIVEHLGLPGASLFEDL
jgi:hypothetical protein